jgi:hypothetical protein
LVRVGRLDEAEQLLGGVIAPPSIEQSLYFMQPLWSARCELEAARQRTARLQETAALWARTARAEEARLSSMQAAYWVAEAALSQRELDRAREAIDTALAYHASTPVPLLACRLYRTAERVALLDREFVAAAEYREIRTSWVAHMASTLDDPRLRQSFRELMRHSAPAEGAAFGRGIPHPAGEPHVEN